LRDLLICDRIKASLDECVLRYIMAVEAKSEKGWLPSKELTAAIDTYVANHIGERPRSGVLTASKKSNFEPPKQNLYPPKSFVNKNTSSGCFVCGSKAHMKRDCPNKNTQKYPTAQNGKPTAFKANRCVRDARNDRVEVGSGSGLADRCGSAGQQSTPSPMSDVVDSCRVDDCHNDVCDTVVTGQASDDANSALDLTCKASSEELNVKTVNICDTNYVSMLNYVQIGVSSSVDGNLVSVNCLEDSGTEIAVLKSSVIDLSDVQSIGSVKIRGIVGQPVDCTLVRLYVRLLDSDKQSPVVPIVCAVTDEAHEQMIIPRDVFDRMHSMEIYASPQSLDKHPIDDSYTDPVRPKDQSVNITTRSGLDTDVKSDDSGHSGERSPAAEVTDDNVAAEVVDADQPLDGKDDIAESIATREQLIKDQQEDETLRTYWKWVKLGKGNLFLQDGVMMHYDKYMGHNVTQLVVPKHRRSQVLEMGHDMAGHASWKKSLQRIKLNFTWPQVRADMIEYVKSCEICQKRA